MKIRDLESFGAWDDALVLVRRFPGTIFGLATLGAIPSSALSIFWSMNLAPAQRWFAYPIHWLSIVFFAYLMTEGISELSHHEDGRLRDVVGSSSIRRFFSFASTRLLMTILLIPLTLVFALPVFIVMAISPESALDTIGPAAALFPLTGLTLGFLFYGLSAPANVVEGLRPAAALRRSWRITEGHRKDFLVLCIGPFCLTGLFLTVGAAANGGPLYGRTQTSGAGSLFSKPAGPADPLSITDAFLQGLWTYGERMLSSAVWAVLLTTFFIRLLNVQSVGHAPRR
jgi:hypothetical protein